MDLVNKDGSINSSKEFLYKGKRLKISKTESNEKEKSKFWDHSVWNALDTVLNIDNGKTIKISRLKLKKLNIKI